MAWLDERIEEFERGEYRLLGPIGSVVGAGLRGAEVASGIELGDVGVGGIGGDTVNDAGEFGGDIADRVGDVFVGGGSGVPTGPEGSPNSGIPTIGEVRGLIQLFLTGMLTLVVVYVLGSLFEFQFVIGDGE